jgi:hypothetical protein
VQVLPGTASPSSTKFRFAYWAGVAVVAPGAKEATLNCTFIGTLEYEIELAQRIAGRAVFIHSARFDDENVLRVRVDY